MLSAPDRTTGAPAGFVGWSMSGGADALLMGRGDAASPMDYCTTPIKAGSHTGKQFQRLTRNDAKVNVFDYIERTEASRSAARWKKRISRRSVFEEPRRPS